MNVVAMWHVEQCDLLGNVAVWVRSAARPNLYFIGVLCLEYIAVPVVATHH